jgi:putative membrane protein
MRKIFLSGILSGLAIVGLNACAGDQTNDRNKVPSNSNSAVIATNNANISSNTANANKASTTDDYNFMTKAAQGGMAEVELGKLAVSKAQNAEVKKFAQKMIEDHTNANTELKSLATKKGVTLPAEVNAEQKATMDKLKALSGAEFDKAYVQAMVDDHKKTVDLFQTESTGGTDNDTKAFASKTLPHLKEHLELIQGIQGKMK